MPLELFAVASGGRESPEADAAMRSSLEVVRARREAGKLYDGDGRLAADLLQGDLARAGYWGLLIPAQYGGGGASLSQYTKFLTKVAAIDGSVANLLSVHSCLGPAGVVRNFGNEEQKQRWLPTLARGERLGVFALTEPQAGSDLTAIATRADLSGDVYRVTGEKVFITNLAPGRIAALVCRVDGRPTVLIGQLPDRDTEAVSFIDYGIHAARRSGNRGMRLTGFEVPQRDLMTPVRGDGLTIAYHGLNQGRMSLCAVAAGTLRRMLAALLPWVRSRRTYGEAIGSRELVQRRIGRLASLIVGCDALAAWCASLLDRGYRGELECIVAKIFAAETLKEATIEIGLRTFGGRSFLHGNLIGDSLHDLLAPCIYEGESELLGLALVHALCKTIPPGPTELDPPPSIFRWQSWKEAFKRAAFERARPQVTREFFAGWSPSAEQEVEMLRHIGRSFRAIPAWPSGEFAKQSCSIQSGMSTLVQNYSILACLSFYADSCADSINHLAARALGWAIVRECGGDEKYQYSDAEPEIGRRIIQDGWAELEGVPVEAMGQIHAIFKNY